MTSDAPVAVRATPPSRPSKKRLLRRIVGYALSRGMTEIMLAIRGVLLAVILGPLAFGTWALLRLAMRYSALGALGLYRGLEVELLQGDQALSSRQRDAAAAAALGFVLVISGTLAGIALGSSFLVQDSSVRLVLRGFAAASLAETLYGYALVCTRIRGNLRRFSFLETGTSMLHVLFAVGLAWAWGLGGAFIGLTLANLLGVAAAMSWVPFRPAFELAPVRRMFRVGFPVVLTLAVGILLATGDRWVVALWGGPAMLGQYAFAGSVTMVAGALAIVIRTVVFPQVYGEASSSGAAVALRSHMEGALLPFARLVPPLLGALSFALAPLVAVAAPSYLEAIAPGRVFLLAGAATGLVNLATVGAMAAGRQHRLPLYALTALALTLTLSILALISGLGLGAVASATFAGHLLFAALVLRLNVRETGVSNAERLVATILLPLVWCAVAVGLSGFLFPRVDYGSAAAALGVYLAFLLPLLPLWRDEWRRLRAHHSPGN